MFIRCACCLCPITATLLLRMEYLYMPLFRIGQFSLSCPPKVSARMKHEGLRTLLVCQRVTCKYNAYNSNSKKPMLCHMLRDSAALYVVSCDDRSAAYSEKLCTTPGTNKGSPRFSIRDFLETCQRIYVIHSGCHVNM